MLGNLVGKDLAGMAVSWAKVLKWERIPLPHHRPTENAEVV